MKPLRGVFYVGEWRVEPSLRTLTRAEVSTRLEPKVFAVLCCLAESAGEVVAREHLIERVWAGTFVTDDVLVRAISQLRRLFNDDARHPHVIQTLPKGGYRLLAAVRQEQEPWPEAVLEWKTAATHDSPRRSIPAARALLLYSALLVLVFIGIGTLGNALYSRKVGGSTTIRSVMVLPFESLSGDGNRHLADGVTEGLIDELVRLHDLERVIGRATSMRYQRSAAPLRSIAEELKVAAFVTGSVQLSEGRVRVTARLVEAADERVRWSETYTRDLAHLPGLWRDIVRTLARVLRLELDPSEQEYLFAPPTRVHHDAYVDYLRGKAASRGNDVGAAIRSFERAIERDPGFAAAWGELARTLVQQSYFGPLGDTLPQARAAAERALTLAPETTAARIALGRIRLHVDWDWEGAGRELERARAGDPHNTDARWQYAFYLRIMGRIHEALREARPSVELDPLSPFGHFQLAFLQRASGQAVEAVAEMDRALALQPDSRFLRQQLAMTRVLAGDYRRARVDFESVPHDLRSTTNIDVAYLFAVSGDVRRARQIAIELERRYQRSGRGNGAYTTAFAIACVYAGLRDFDRAFAWLQQAFVEREFSLAQLPADPYFQGLHADRRYAALLKGMGYPQP